MDSAEGKPPAEAADYYQRAADVYRKIIAASRADEKYAPQPATAAALQISLARCLRRLGKYEEALNALVEVLAVRENRIDAQREAAQTYQAWGEEAPDNFLLAIHGGRRIERPGGAAVNLVWGWGGIARKVQFNESLQDVFNEARYNLALCRMKYGLGKSDPERTDMLRQAEQDILVVQRLRPDVGGKKWYDKYDGLLRKIQQSLGVKADEQGLKAAEGRLSSAEK